MTTEAKAEVIETPDGEQTVIVELPQSEAEQAPTSEAVEIAEIEAERDVTIEAIHADTEAARIEAESERENTWQNELGSIREQVEVLAGTVTTLAEAMETLTNPLTPPALELGTMEEPIADPTITLEIPTEALDETRTEALERNAEDVQEIPIVAKRKAHMI